jgi:chaperonin GroEL
METILTGAEARSKLLVGVNKLANSIKGTLGPNARTVVIQNPMGGMPVIINDGVSIARMVNDKDPYVQMGIDLLKEVASEAQQKSGDGTTSATLIAQTLCNGSLTLMENGTSPLVIRDALKSYLAATEEYVRESAIEDFDLKDVATIAANNDGELGELIAGVVKRGQGITIERSPTNETYVKRASGFEMNAGYAHALMANAPRAKCEFDNPMVLTTTEKISTFNALVPALEAAVKQNKPLVIFCSDFNGQMLQNLLVNIVQGKVSVCMIKSLCPLRPILFLA